MSKLIDSEMAGVTLQAFESDRRKHWIVERGIEIISEASRHLTAELKQRHPQIPWPKVARAPYDGERAMAKAAMPWTWI